MEIVQLSDIHVGSQFREETFQKVIDEINSLKPDAVVITGDLTNEGLIEQYEKCKKLISQIDVDKIIAIIFSTLICEIIFLHFSYCSINPSLVRSPVITTALGFNELISSITF